VGYSKNPMEEQRRSTKELEKIVASTPQYREGNRTGNLIATPTGDGMALVFFGPPTAAAECAVEIGSLVRSRRDLPLRMGLNTGMVYRVADINRNLNVSGGGVNGAQRVMDAGDTGHILVAASTADILKDSGTWVGRLTDLGDHLVKHDVSIHFYNLCTTEAGNSAWPSRWAPRGRRRPSWLRYIGIGASVVLLGVAGEEVFRRAQPPVAPHTDTKPEKPANVDPPVRQVKAVTPAPRHIVRVMVYDGAEIPRFFVDEKAVQPDEYLAGTATFRLPAGSHGIRAEYPERICQARVSIPSTTQVESQCNLR